MEREIAFGARRRPAWESNVINCEGIIAFLR